jgi:integrase
VDLAKSSEKKVFSPYNIDQYDSVKRWKSRLAESTYSNGKFMITKFFNWAYENGRELKSKNPDELVEFQRFSKYQDKYKILDLVQAYILSYKGYRYKTKTTLYSTIRGFFKNNRAQLPSDDFRSRIKGDVPPVTGKLSMQDLKNIALKSRPCQRAIWLCMFQGGMGQKEFHYWNRNGYDELVEQLDRNPSVIKINLPGRKHNNTNYYTLIGSDAIKALKQWLKIRPPDGESIFTNLFGNVYGYDGLRKNWFDKTVDLGLIKRPPKGKRHDRLRYGKNLHELRDLFITQFEMSPANGLLAQFMTGHVIDTNMYNKFYRHYEDYVVDEYRKALPYLNVISSPTALGLIPKAKVRRLMDENILLVQDMLKMMQEIHGLEEVDILDLSPTYLKWKKKLDD